jgi:CHAT domain-containing protein
MAARLPGPVLLLEPDAGPAAPADSARTPTRDAVRELLPGCAIAHFACHGMSELVDPSRSRLLLHDHDTAPLTVAELAPVRLERAQLAYLSACRTAFGASRLLDESVHLASAFLLAGFPHVIAAAWEIADFLAPSVAADFYARLTDRAGAEAGRINTDRAAEALHHTVRALRERYPDQPALWAAYLHVGA